MSAQVNVAAMLIFPPVLFFWRAALREKYNISGSLVCTDSEDRGKRNADMWSETGGRHYAICLCPICAAMQEAREVKNREWSSKLPVSVQMK